MSIRVAARELKANLGRKIAASSVARAAHDVGLSAVRERRRAWLKEEDVPKRLAFARKYVGADTEWLERLVFVDEKMVDTNGGRRWRWVEEDDPIPICPTSK
jgi:hypothetical protein